MVLTNPSVIKEIKNKFGFEFKKAYGQNFLTSDGVLQDICCAASGADGIIEIGPGFGTLTNSLAAAFDKVLAVEIDARLKPVLNYTLKEHDNVNVLLGDCMKMDFTELINEHFPGKSVSVAANLPYYITTPIITMLIESRLPLDKIVVMVQKEVAQRLCAQPGSKEFGAISVLCSYYTNPEIITVVPAGCFVPSPKVDSAVVAMKVRKEPAVNVVDEKMFFSVVKAAFSQRRKTLCNCLNSYFTAEKQIISDLLTQVGVDPGRRGETLTLAEFAAISDKFSEANIK